MSMHTSPHVAHSFNTNIDVIRAAILVEAEESARVVIRAAVPESFQEEQSVEQSKKRSALGEMLGTRGEKEIVTLFHYF